MNQWDEIIAVTLSIHQLVGILFTIFLPWGESWYFHPYGAWMAVDCTEESNHFCNILWDEFSIKDSCNFIASKNFQLLINFCTFLLISLKYVTSSITTVASCVLSTQFSSKNDLAKSIVFLPW